MIMTLLLTIIMMNVCMMMIVIVQYRSWAKCFFGGAQLGRAKPRGFALKIFEIFFPKIAVNASNFIN